FCGYYFFFQAEDGIRDLIVTGVQTCALPISAAAPRASGRAATPSAPPSRAVRAVADRRGLLRLRLRARVADGAAGVLVHDRPRRSEERRVGKECRYWLLPYDYKKRRWDDKEY